MEIKNNIVLVEEVNMNKVLISPRLVPCPNDKGKGLGELPLLKSKLYSKLISYSIYCPKERRPKKGIYLYNWVVILCGCLGTILIF